MIREGFEPATHRLEICCSIQLSYRTNPHLDFSIADAKIRIFFYSTNISTLFFCIISKKRTFFQTERNLNSQIYNIQSGFAKKNDSTNLQKKSMESLIKSINHLIKTTKYFLQQRRGTSCHISTNFQLFVSNFGKQSVQSTTSYILT